MKRKKVLITIEVIIAIASILICTLIYTFFFSMARLPQGEFLSESTSVDGKYTIKTYLCNGGATVDYAVRGEVIINNNKSNKKNIYWDYKINKSDIKWEDNDTVIINGKKIDLPNGKYDWRNNKK